VTRAPARASRLTPATLLAAAYVGGAIGMWGTFFDTSWHRTLARDTFWSLPHLFMYGGGVVVWVAVTTALVLASRGMLPDVGGPVWRLGALRLPFGFALATLGVLTVIFAAPVDIWYHGYFGKDVLIWSPPHMQAVVGGMIAASGLLFAAAAQCGRGALRRPTLWLLAVMLPAVHVIHLAHYALAHYTMTPWTRTPDFYPLLVAIMFPALLVALARGAGAFAPVGASLLFLAASLIVDWALHAIGFARYTITPVIAVPALALAAVYVGRGRATARLSRAVVAALAFMAVFLAIEAAWMAAVVDKPWPVGEVLRGLPAVVVAAVLSAFVGWVWGGFLGAPRAGGADEVFGGRTRARGFAVAALALVGASVITVYRPQIYGPPMNPGELALEPSSRFPVQEAVFWEAVLDEDFGREPELVAYSEGIIDGIPLPVGPGWCAADAAQLARELPYVQFVMEINGTPLDLTGYPLVRQTLRDGRECSWIGVISRRQRASQNRLVYTITPRAGAPETVRPTRVVLRAVFKDP
jgi:hypothetical protein